MSAAFKIITKEKDGDDFDTRVDIMSISVANNGYILETTYDDEEFSKEVCLDLKSLLELIEKRMRA